MPGGWWSLLQTAALLENLATTMYDAARKLSVESGVLDLCTRAAAIHTEHARAFNEAALLVVQALLTAGQPFPPDPVKLPAPALAAGVAHAMFPVDRASPAGEGRCDGHPPGAPARRRGARRGGDGGDRLLVWDVVADAVTAVVVSDASCVAFGDAAGGPVPVTESP
ncbi:hypothetical protein GCM10009827_070670 [Dactylosporangium maewongense]|uniref:Uncharacterized protein n=1 Tax=Dactylosporangium maewongense TaxID=634393 RepID=A0ABP4MAZ5_9ACTN